ncbi:head decoration protein [Acidocella sp.]|uniref:head decoration protein n=1 Tax=Acidocella sp. TaxID=50710 RepID=UPI00262EF95D|nr:head decoration protein [Acidocella sp.]MDD2794369.1 head decoration protein [Acidocella sp.]
MSAFVSNFGPSSANEIYVPDRLIAGVFPTVTDTVNIAAGQQLTRGALLGMVTASGNYILSLSAAADGSQNPVAVLADNIDTTATGFNAVTPAPVYLTGEFNVNEMTLGTGFAYPAIKATLRPLSIFIKQGQVATPIL